MNKQKYYVLQSFVFKLIIGMHRVYHIIYLHGISLIHLGIERFFIQYKHIIYYCDVIVRIYYERMSIFHICFLWLTRTSKSIFSMKYYKWLNPFISRFWTNIENTQRFSFTMATSFKSPGLNKKKKIRAVSNSTLDQAYVFRTYLVPRKRNRN